MNIQEVTYPTKRFLTLKKSISTDQITDSQMYDEAGKQLGAYMQEHSLTPSGPWSTLYFYWNELEKKAEIGIGFPIDNLDTVNDTELRAVEVAESPAALLTLHGDYSGMGITHKSLMDYIEQKGLDTSGLEVKAVEEYPVSPMEEESSDNWVTNIYYLHN